MIRLLPWAAVAVGLALLCAPISAARAQAEFPPSQGKGPVVMVVSGQGGAARYQPAAQQVAQLGYDAILVDGNDMEGSHGQALKAAVQQARNAAFVRDIKVPVLMFAGESDTYKSCRLIGTARALAAASAHHAPLELVTYPRTEHDFIFPGRQYNATATSDSWQRARIMLGQYLGH